MHTCLLVKFSGECSNKTLPKTCSVLRPLPADPKETPSLLTDSWPLTPDSLDGVKSKWLAAGGLQHSAGGAPSVRSEKVKVTLDRLETQYILFQIGGLLRVIQPGLLSWQLRPSTHSAVQYRQLLSLCSWSPVSSEPSILSGSCRLTATSSLKGGLAGRHPSVEPESERRQVY